MLLSVCVFVGHFVVSLGNTQDFYLFLSWSAYLFLDLPDSL